MSKEDAMAFIRKASQDAELQKKLVAFAHEQGYHFTVEELSVLDADYVVGGKHRPKESVPKKEGI